MKKITKILFLIIIISLLLILTINFYVIKVSDKKIVENNNNLKNVDCILILGAGIWGDKPSPMLQDRLDEGIKLYKSGIASKIIMSGDHGNKNYDEVI